MKAGETLARDEYLLLLNHVNRSGTIWLDCEISPIPGEVLVFPPRAKELQTIHHKGRNFSTRSAHEANSCVLFQEPDRPSQRSTGFITRMWMVLLPPRLHTIVLVERHGPFPNPEDNLKGPYHRFPRFATKIVSMHAGEQILLSLDQLIGQCLLWRREHQTYGISEDFFVVNFAAHRNRRV